MGDSIDDGQAQGWSLQDDWWPDTQSWYHREASLPAEAWQMTSRTRAPDPTDGWHHTEITVHDGFVSAAYDGQPLAVQGVGTIGCGAIVLRVWDTRVTFRNVSISPAERSARQTALSCQPCRRGSQ